MEAILIGAAAQYLIPLLGAVLTALAGYGIFYLRKKLTLAAQQQEEGLVKDSLEMAHQALGALDGIVSTTVGNIAQTTAKEMLRTSKKANLNGLQKQELKAMALAGVKNAMTDELRAAAEKAVKDLDGYVSKKIEDTVLKLKG